MMSRALALCLWALLLIAGPVAALPVGYGASFSVGGGSTWNIPTYQVAPESVQYGMGNSNGTGWNWTGAGSTVSISGLLDPDPVISYGISVSNFLPVSQTYSFSFTIPLLPAISGPSVVSSSIVGGFTDLFGTGVTFNVTGAAQKSSLGLPVTNMGIDVGPSFSAPGTGIGGSFYSYGAFASGLVAGPPGTWTTMTVNLAFELSANTIAVLTGFTNITQLPVPLPPALPLFLAGLLGLVLRGRHQRSPASKSA